MHFPKEISLVLLSLLMLSLGSCDKFEGEQSVPAYLSVDSIYLSTDVFSQGTASHKITDAWIYVDDEFIGAFEMPAIVPVLKSGKHTVKIFPGIKKNGISATRVTYPFYTSIQKDITLTPDDTTSLKVLKTTYQSTTIFTWKENFENLNVTLDTTQSSLVPLTLTNSIDSTFEDLHSGKAVLIKDFDFFEAQTEKEYMIPSAPVYLEMNFNTNNSITVGVFVYGTSTLYKSPIITLNPTQGEWKKIYIDLTTTLNAYRGMSSFRVYLGTFLDPGLEKGTILLDNFKVVTKPS